MRVVPLRLINQHAGRELRSVRDTGEELLVTDHNRVIARVVPEHDAENPRDRLVQRGRLVRPATSVRPLPPLRPTTGADVAEILADIKGEH